MNLNGNKKLCYLVGQISPLADESYNWRNYVIEEMLDYSDEIGFINPCANPFNQKVHNEKRYAVDVYGKDNKRSFGIDILPHKDYNFVLQSDIAIANLNQYDLNKPLLGTFFELAWYFLSPEKTVIGFADDYDHNYNCKHPFVQRAITTWCQDVTEAVYLLKKYFTTES